MLAVAGCESGDTDPENLSDAGGLPDVADVASDGIADASQADLVDDSGNELPDPACEAVSDLRVATFNIRYAGLSGENAWYALPVARRDLVLETMRAIDADVFGLQEVLYAQAVDVQAEFSDYHFVGVGRDDGELAGEFAAILLRRERFELIEQGHFWMSETPDVPGTVFEGSGAIRMSSWAVVKDKTSGRELLVLNTHWDHRSSSSRESSANLTRARMPELAAGRSVVLTGDLNASPEDGALLALLAADPDAATQLIDSYRVANPVESNDEATFHGFGGDTRGNRIDYVLHTAGLRADSASIHRDSFEGAYPSDHFPVTAELRWRFAVDGELCVER